MSEMLTEMVPGQEDSSDLELLQVSVQELSFKRSFMLSAPQVPAIPALSQAIAGQNKHLRTPPRDTFSF